MAKKNEFNSVTNMSKALAFVMFVTFPFIGFYIGMHYQKELDKNFMQEVYAPQPTQKPVVTPGDNTMCTMDALQCPDESSVGRVGPNCEFAKCPGE